MPYVTATIRFRQPSRQMLASADAFDATLFVSMSSDDYESMIAMGQPEGLRVFNSAHGSKFSVDLSQVAAISCGPRRDEV